MTMEAGDTAGPAPEVVQLIKATLLAQRGFANEGAGVPLERLCDLVEDEKALAADDDFERVYDACDSLESEGWLRIVNGDEDDDNDDDMLYLATAGVDVGPSMPPNAVVFDKDKHATYDYAAEERATEAIAQALTPLRRFGVDKQDASLLPALQRACEELALLTEQSPAPPLRDDPRLLGDWELVGTTSSELAQRGGLTGLGTAPFTSPVTVFYVFDPSGAVIAKEVLEFFGRPVVVNELRGRFGFSEDGAWLQEKYSEADLSGARNSAQFTEATATSRAVCISADGALRLGFTPGSGFFVFKKLEVGQMNAWLEERSLPLVGGTVATLDKEEMAKAYPYLAKRQAAERGGGGGGWNPFG